MRAGEYRLRGIGHATGTATTTAAAVAIPDNATAVRILVGAACEVGIGTASSAPALGTSNAALFAANESQLWYIIQGARDDTYLYLETPSATATYTINFYV